MNNEYMVLSNAQVALATALILVNAAISLLFSLGLERRLLIASVRTIVQLILIGFVLQFLIRENLWYYVLPMMIVMTVIAGIAGVNRTSRLYSGIYLDSVVSVWATSWIVLSIGLFGILQVSPESWYNPRFTLPILGLILGNSLNGISLGLERFGEELTVHRNQVETLFTLGATRWEAVQPFVRKAIGTGMVPVLNSMMVVGLVNLPGIMTGQVIAGIDPVEAVKYQIIIMFLVASGAALGTVAVVLLCYRRLFTTDHQFLYWRLRKKGKK
jgi:putative ABC transport system permease protein